MSAAYSVWDERAVLPGNLRAATKAADPTPVNERRIIGTGPYVLTRQALSHWARWNTSGDHQRLQLRNGLVGQRDANALEQLERNLLDVGPRQTWFVVPLKNSRQPMREGLADGLLRGLTMDARVLPALLKILGLRCEHEEKLEKTLQAMERVEIISRPVAPVAAAPQAPDERTEGEDMSAMRQRVKAQLEERNVNLREVVTEATKRQIADVLGVHSSTVNRHVCDLRREAGIEVDRVQSISAEGTIKDRLKAQIEARKIDITQPVANATQEALAITLNTTKATVNGYLVQLRAEARKAAEKAQEQQPQEHVEEPVESVVVEVDFASQIETKPCRRCDQLRNELRKLPAEIDMMRSQLQALASERDLLRKNVAEWTETAQETDRARVRWMDEALSVRSERDGLAGELKAMLNGSSRPCQDEPAYLPVATVPQAISNAEVREITGYEAVGAEVGRLVESKQQQYGDSFGRSGNVLRQFYPDGIKPEQMDDALAVVRITDKLFRIASGNQGGENAFADIAGYGLLGAAKGVSN